MTPWPFDGLIPLRYGAIIADPPWAYTLYSAAGEKKAPQAHYGCMPFDQLAALPVNQLAAPDCALIMWATAPLLPDAICLMSAWGFTYKTAGTWAKRGKADGAWSFGTGYILRSAAEFYIIGTTGRPRVRSRSVRNLIVAPVREHSRKPDDLHRQIEQLWHGPYAELFGRERRPGWDVWGNEVGKFEAAA